MIQIDPSRTLFVSMNAEESMKVMFDSLMVEIENIFIDDDIEEEITKIVEHDIEQKIEWFKQKLKSAIAGKSERSKELMRTHLTDIYLRGGKATDKLLKKEADIKRAGGLYSSEDDLEMDDISGATNSMLQSMYLRFESDVISYIHRALRENQPKHIILAEVKNMTGKRKHQVRTLVQTETVRTFNVARRKRFERVGIKRWRWITSRERASGGGTKPDDKVCPICMPLHNTEVNIGKPFAYDKKFGYIYQPPAHPNCRCTVRMAFVKGADLDVKDEVTKLEPQRRRKKRIDIDDDIKAEHDQLKEERRKKREQRQKLRKLKK